MLKVAVRLPSITDQTGEYLADISALDAAGADTIWLENGALEAWVVLGALAAVTHHARLGWMLTSGVPAAGEFAAGVDAAQKLSRGRIVLAVPPVHVATIKSARATVFSLGGAAGGSVDGEIHKLAVPSDAPFS